MGLIDYYFSFVDWILSFPWRTYTLVLKIFMILVGVASLFWYIVSMRKLKALPPDPRDLALGSAEAKNVPKTLPREIVAKPWLEIQSRMSSPNSADWSVAVIQADGVLDQILKASGYRGDTMGDRLKQINSAELASVDDIWRAHKIRNRLAHAGEGALTRQDAEEAIRAFEKAFKELNYID